MNNSSEKTNLIKWGIVTPKKNYKNVNLVMSMDIIMLMEAVMLLWE